MAGHGGAQWLAGHGAQCVKMRDEMQRERRDRRLAGMTHGMDIDDHEASGMPDLLMRKYVCPWPVMPSLAGPAKAADARGGAAAPRREALCPARHSTTLCGRGPAEPWGLRGAPSLRPPVPSCLRTLWLNVLRGAVQFDGAVAQGRAGEPATLLALGGNGDRIALAAAGAAERQLFFKSPLFSDPTC